MKITFEKQTPAEKKQLSDTHKNDLETSPKKEIKKEEILNEVEKPLASALADLIIQQNLS